MSVITLEKFEAKVSRTESCWEWTGAISPTGYPRFGSGYAHRASYELFVGPIPDGLHIDHLCRVRHCVNPAHLEAVTQRENTLRGTSPIAIAVRTNRCKRGHEYTPENTYTRPDGSARNCKACANANRAKRGASR